MEWNGEFEESPCTLKLVLVLRIGDKVFVLCPELLLLGGVPLFPGSLGTADAACLVSRIRELSNPESIVVL